MLLWSTVDEQSHSSFGVRRLVAAMAWVSGRKRRQVAALHSALVICPSFARILTRTFKLHPVTCHYLPNLSPRTPRLCGEAFGLRLGRSVNLPARSHGFVGARPIDGGHRR